LLAISKNMFRAGAQEVASMKTIAKIKSGGVVPVPPDTEIMNDRDDHQQSR